MRTSYAALKAFTFGWMLLLSVLSEGVGRWRPALADLVHSGLKVGWWAAVLTAAMCIVRGIPVIVEGVALIRSKEGELGHNRVS